MSEIEVMRSHWNAADQLVVTQISGTMDKAGSGSGANKASGQAVPDAPYHAWLSFSQ